MHEKLKSLIVSDQTFYSLLVILVGLGAFLLGGGEVIDNKAEIASKATALVGKSTKEGVSAPQSLVVTEVKQGAVVGSKTGTKFHLLDCPGASQIKLENRIEFASVADAMAAGYKPAANCPGLVQ